LSRCIIITVFLTGLTYTEMQLDENADAKDIFTVKPSKEFWWEIHRGGQPIVFLCPISDSPID
jgi:hypothetical protein